MQQNRFWEIDFGRGVAVLAMIVFHALFDLNYFAGYSFNLSQGFWWWFGRATAAAFVFLVGIGLSLSYASAVKNGFSFVAKKFFVRGAKTLALGLLVTLATYVFLEGRGTIWFGVLHFIGIAVIVSLPFLHSALLSLAAAVVSIAIGVFLESAVVETPYLLWLGFRFPSFYSFDYFPLFPWLGVMLPGVVAGKKLYARGKRVFALDEPKNYFVNVLCFAGRNSLLIYFVHQPLLIAFILLLKSGFVS